MYLCSCCSLSLECRSLASSLSVLFKALCKGHRLWLKGHFLRRQTPLLPTPSCYRTRPHIFCLYPAPVASHLKTSFCVVAENMAPEVHYLDRVLGTTCCFSPSLSLRFLSGKMELIVVPTSKNYYVCSTPCQALSQAIGHRLHLSSVITEEMLSKFQYCHRHRYQTLGRDEEKRG